MPTRDDDEMRKSEALLTRFELSILTGLPLGQLAIYAPVLLVGAPTVFLAGWLVRISGAPSFAYLPLGMLVGLAAGVVTFLILNALRGPKE